MFSLLSPFSLWLGAALAVPLAIHFLGRQRLRKQPFPSLLLVRDLFAKSMHRHRLKNFLLLLIRTLLLLCLLFALSNPVLNSIKVSTSHPDHSAALIHNGIYGRLSVEHGKNALEAQRSRLRSYDSTEGTHSVVCPLIEDGPGMWTISDRFGNYRDGLSRLMTTLGANAGTVQIHIPVFSWSELFPATPVLIRALKENPGLQLVLTDYENAGARVHAFMGIQATPASDGPIMKIISSINVNVPRDKLGKLQVFLNGRIFQESTPDGSRIEVTIPLSDGPQTTGKLSLPQFGFANPDYFFCFPNSGTWKMAHTGSVLTSLPSLGKETYFRRIEHVASLKDIPWTEGLGPQGKETSANLKVVYLANDRNRDPQGYAKVVEFVKKGGRLIIGVGQETDIPMLNRFLLQPLRLGRLGNLVESPTSSPVSVNRMGLAKLGGLPKDLGGLGSVHKRFAFLPDSGTELLLSQMDPASAQNAEAPTTPSRQAGAVLVAGDFHRGKVLLWTTDIDDLNWCDLGVRPITPLLHQALQETGSEGQAQNHSIPADSILVLNVDEIAMVANHQSVSEAPTSREILDPDGMIFSKVRVVGPRLYLGPFDHLGIYKIIQDRDTTEFAVNLAANSGGVSQMGQASGSDWEHENEQAKATWLAEFKDFPGRLIVQSSRTPVTGLASVMTLWPKLFLAAILLLFLEGIIALAFSLKAAKI